LRIDIERYLAERLPGVPPAAHRPLRRWGALLTNEVMVVALHRLAHAAWAAGHPRMAAALAALVRAVFKASLDPTASIGGGWFLPHPAGAVVQGCAGAGLTMYARSVMLADGAAQPCLGDNVVLAGMAGVVGPARVGNDVRVGFNMHLAGPAPTGVTVAGAPMRVHVGTLDEAALLETAAPGGLPPELDPRQYLTEDLAALSKACQGGRGPLTSRLAVRLFRASQWAWQQGLPVRARRLWQLNVWVSGADLDPRSRIGPGLVLRHSAGVSLHVVAGCGLAVGPLVVAGPAHARDPDGLGPVPQLGNHVELGVHAKICGPWRIGDGARVGAGVGVDADVPDGHAVEAAQPRLLRGRATPQN
jgi:serine acetyltransferase